MRSLVFDGPERVRLTEVEVPEPGPGQALVRIEASAICGSELESPPGSNPGHEAAGVVERIGDGSGDIGVVGKRVGLSAVTGCGTCQHCLAGEQVYCARVSVTDRMHADYAVVPIRALRELPAGITAADAVLLTGDACGVPIRALRRVPTPASRRVLVLGLGPVGLAHVLVRAHQGDEVIGIEPSSYRRDLARTLGATQVLEPGSELPWQPDLVIESTGIPACIQDSFTMVAPGGTVLQSGWCTRVDLDPAATVLRREVFYTGTWYYADSDYPTMVQLYEEGLAVSAMATHEFPADDISAAYRQFVGRESGKVIIAWT